MKKVLLSVFLFLGLLCCGFAAFAAVPDTGVYASTTKAMIVVPVGLPSQAAVTERQSDSAMVRTNTLTKITSLIGGGSSNDKYAKGSEVTLAALSGNANVPKPI